MTTEAKQILHLLRNSWSWSAEEIRAARLAACDLIERQAAEIAELVHDIDKYADRDTQRLAELAILRAAATPPREPTQEMQQAGVYVMFDKLSDSSRRVLLLIARKGWRAMYDAAPVVAPAPMTDAEVDALATRSDEELVRLLREMPIPEHLGGGLIKQAGMRILYLSAQEDLLEEWQQRCIRAEEALAETKRPLDAQMAALNERVIKLNAELSSGRASVATADAEDAKLWVARMLPLLREIDRHGVLSMATQKGAGLCVRDYDAAHAARAGRASK